MRSYLIVGVIMLMSGFKALSQEILSFSHTYNNLYLINPAAAGVEGHGIGFLTYHKNWQSIEGAPQTASLSFNTLTKGKKVNLGFNIFNDQRSILSSSGLLLTVGYAIHFSEQSNLRFGLSGGASFNTFDLNKMVVQDEDDLSLINKLNNSIAPDGNAGIYLKLRGFHAGFTMPKLFSSPVLTGDNVAKVELQQFDNLLFNVGWKMKLVPNVLSFHPMVNYKMYEGTKGQYDATAVIDFHDAFWIGGNYKEDYGYGIIAGIKVKKISIAYAYEMPSPDIYKYSGASHEIQLGIHFGKKKVEKKPAAKQAPPVKKVVPTQKPVTNKPVVPPAQFQKQTVTTTQTQKQVVPTTTIQTPPVSKPVVEQEKPKQEVIRLPEPKKETVIAKPVVEEKQNVVHLPAAPKANVIIKKDTVNKTISYQTATKTIEVSDKEKLVIAAKGTHALELQEGNYVVVGAFSVFENATKFKNQIKDLGYPAQLGYNSEKKLYYVYIFSNQDVPAAIEKKNSLRSVEEFKNAWLFIVE